MGVGVFALALAACEPAPFSPTPAPRPQAPSAAQTAGPSVARARTSDSLALEAYYKQVQASLLRNELLRTDNGGPDTPFGARQLAANFEAIALRDEYNKVNGQFVVQSVSRYLRRWEEPVRIGLEFGASIPQAQRQKDRATVEALTRDLTRTPGLSVSLSQRPNFHVLVLNENEVRSIGPRIAALMPGVSNAAIRYVEALPSTDYCLVLATDPADDGVSRQAVAIIRGENPDLLRKSCFHEEIAQGLGLPNDSPDARPSIFNDDEEFALLTHHDRLLLRILYDPRLRPGMRSDTARPIIAQIARELMGETT